MNKRYSSFQPRQCALSRRLCICMQRWQRKRGVSVCCQFAVLCILFVARTVRF